MAQSKVFFTDFRTKMYGDGLPLKFKNLIKAAGILDIDMDGKFVAIKTHFGELGNLSFLRPNYARALVEVIKEAGGKPFLTDCNTLYPGFRKNALEHMECAWLNGFTPYTVGCPVIIADGLKGTDDVDVPVVGGEYIKEAHIGHAIMDADIVISLNHFKGHEEMGFGGALKNLGMGCGSRAGKKDMHNDGKPQVDPDLCRACGLCARTCANNGLKIDPATGKMKVTESCLGCGRCIGACNFDAISFTNNCANDMLGKRVAEYSKAVIDGRPNFHITLVVDVSPNCDCHSENDVPILPNIGMFASFDPLALDQACADACLAATPLPGSQITDNMESPDFEDHHDNFKNSRPTVDWESCLSHAEKIGVGSRNYELIKVFTAK